MASPTWPFGEIVSEVGKTIRQVVPNPGATREHEIALRELDQKVDIAQIGVNTEEAKHANLFVAGWRPFIGWTGGVALGYTWIVAPLLQFAFAVFGNNVDLPALDPDSIWPIVAAMLGLGTMRSYEKGKGVATSVGGRVLTPQKPVDASMDGLY